jgi:hypothetical protein
VTEPILSVWTRGALRLSPPPAEAAWGIGLRIRTSSKRLEHVGELVRRNRRALSADFEDDDVLLSANGDTNRSVRRAVQ